MAEAQDFLRNQVIVKPEVKVLHTMEVEVLDGEGEYVAPNAITPQIASRTATELTGTTGGMTLSGGLYYLTKDATYSGSSAGKSGLTISSGATVYIHIPEGVTLTVKGGNASGTTGAGAGINLPYDATLIFVGEGKVVATGGNAAGGSNGDGAESGVTYSGSGVDGRYYGGNGGKGGSGGAGAGAGIGGSGEYGGTGSSDYDSFSFDGKKYHVAGGGGGGGGEGAVDYSGDSYSTSSSGCSCKGGGGSAGSGYKSGNQGSGTRDSGSYNDKWDRTGGSGASGGSAGGSGSVKTSYIAKTAKLNGKFGTSTNTIYEKYNITFATPSATAADPEGLVYRFGEAYTLVFPDYEDTDPNVQFLGW